LHGLLRVLHRSDRWIELVRPVATTAAQQMFQRASMTSLDPRTKTPQNTTSKEEEPFTKPSKTPPNQTRTDQKQHNPKTHGTSNSPEANPTKGSHRSDRSLTPVRPVIPGQLEMNSTRGPTPDLPIRSTDPNKTLGIVGTPHGHSIAKLWSTKTR
jgi:hypothetical protein